MNSCNPFPSVQPLTTDAASAFRLRFQENSGAFEQAERAFNEPCVTIGAALDSTVKLGNRLGLVSHRHAVIHARDGLFWVVDCASAMGTRLNGHRLRPWLRYRLRAGDCIAVGEYRIAFDLA